MRLNRPAKHVGLERGMMTQPYTPGPYDQRHMYLQWGGALPGGEQWSCGLRLRAKAGVTPVNDPALLTSLQQVVNNFHGRTTTNISGRATLTFCKLNLIGLDGRYVEDMTYEHQYAAGAIGGGNISLTPPNQVALAVSLRTAFARGPAHAGRIYLPLPTITVGSDGLIPVATRDLVKASADQFITELRNAATNYEPAIFSRKASGPMSRVITTTRVGRVLDTQRRRRRNMVESY